ncbi:MAG: DUF1998 domain-containing protein [Rubrobacter sp.]|nr:DUF1998 domain-containing protein [Rubrobacter sp.]
MSPRKDARVGELRPSQLLFSFGVGATVDLPNISAMVMGLDDWGTANSARISEERLLAAVRAQVGGQVDRLLSPPLPPESEGFTNPFDSAADVGVPVAPFPRWMLCPYCRLLAPLKSDLFTLKPNPFRPDRTAYVHENCRKPGKPPVVLPARFLVACERGHLDDFPWVTFVHRGQTECKPLLRLREYGVSGEAADVEVFCDACGSRRRMSAAFGAPGRREMPPCTTRLPHLRTYEEDACVEEAKPILLGASNLWFPVALSTLAVPTKSDPLVQLVEDNWATVKEITSPEVLTAFKAISKLGAFAAYEDADIWDAIQARRENPGAQTDGEALDLKGPEWQVFSRPESAELTEDFRLRRVDPPESYRGPISDVVLVERLREVRALVGFTRIGSPGDFNEASEVPGDRRMPMTRRPPQWVPASEVRGEGIFIRFDEAEVSAWCTTDAARAREQEFLTAHRQWRRTRNIEPPDAGFPGIRYVLLHSFAHAFIRQLALSSGYTAASIRERIYARDPGPWGEPMAGVLLYTAAPDSEGTLGGLVSLGQTDVLGTHLDAALEQVRLCASDPLCAEHAPQEAVLHGAACHACLFASETSCERGNKYLDRSVLVDTFGHGNYPFFDDENS